MSDEQEKPNAIERAPDKHIMSCGNCGCITFQLQAVILDDGVYPKMELYCIRCNHQVNGTFNAEGI